MINLYLSLGSNIGDRAANIHEALCRLDKAFGRSYSSLSDIIETESWGFKAEKFLNCAVLYSIPKLPGKADCQAMDILHKIKDIEYAMGRRENIEYDSEGNRVYHSRPIDIDILFFGPCRIDLPDLKIPHPLAQDRPFVMDPLRQIAKTSLKREFPAIFKNK